MSVHLEQVGSVLTRAVQEVLLRGLNDPRVRGMISVVRVSVSDDLANATVYVSVMPREHEELTLHGLRHAARHIRRQVGERVSMRRVPQLAFRIDRSVKKQSQVLAAIQDAVREDEQRRPGEPKPSEEEQQT
jgi:ribosome-binding factor A